MKVDSSNSVMHSVEQNCFTKYKKTTHHHFSPQLKLKHGDMFLSGYEVHTVDTQVLISQHQTPALQSTNIYICHVYIFHKMNNKKGLQFDSRENMSEVCV